MARMSGVRTSCFLGSSWPRNLGDGALEGGPDPSSQIPRDGEVPPRCAPNSGCQEAPGGQVPPSPPRSREDGEVG